MARPIIALLSDFGSQDHYAGAMKGVALGICPEATLVDISHDIDPHDILGGALQLAASYLYFPQGTVFLVVVDPGVGSKRRGLAADIGDYRFVAPDNGVLTAVFAESPPKTIVEITERRYGRPTVSRTFEGRDRFAPAAAWLAKGTRLAALGRPLQSYRTIEMPAPVIEAESIKGQVIRVDRFGNAVTNIDRNSFERFTNAGAVQLKAGDYRIDRLVTTYEDIGSGEVSALFGSTDHLELAANSSSAAERLGLERGSLVVVTRD